MSDGLVTLFQASKDLSFSYKALLKMFRTGEIAADRESGKIAYFDKRNLGHKLSLIAAEKALARKKAASKKWKGLA